MTTNEIKIKVKPRILKYQIGATWGHRAQEQIFTIKSVIAYYRGLKRGLILSLYDISKYFDKENLKDCMGELYKCDIKGKLYE